MSKRDNKMKNLEDVQRDKRLQLYKKKMMFIKYESIIMSMASGAVLSLSLTTISQNVYAGMISLFMSFILCFAAFYGVREAFHAQNLLGSIEGIEETHDMAQECMIEVLGDMAPKAWKKLQKEVYDNRVSAGMKLLGRGRQ